MAFHSKAFTNTSKITINELRYIFIRFGATTENLRGIMRGMKSNDLVEASPNYNCADSSDGWSFLVNRFPDQMKKFKGVPEFYSDMISWGIDNKYEL